jgi:hypothetical protein
MRSANRSIRIGIKRVASDEPRRFGDGDIEYRSAERSDAVRDADEEAVHAAIVHTGHAGERAVRGHGSSGAG